MGISERKRWMWLRSKLFILDRTRLTAVLIAQQLIDLFTTWWLIFYAKVGEEINPFLQVINEENGLAWMIGIKLFAIGIIARVCWTSLSPKRIKPRFWMWWNGLAYAYTILVMWNTYLVVSTTLGLFPTAI